MVPVIALTGYLGSGKTTLLNHLLRRPGARVGVVVNDFGAIDVDAALLVGHITEAATISGGCVCCMPSGGELDHSLARLTDPRLRLDTVLVEASGLADPRILARLIRSSTARRARLAGVIDVVDAVEHGRTVDVRAEPPARFAAATLVVVSKTDLLAPAAREDALRTITSRIHRRNPRVPVLAAPHGALDPALVFDVARDDDPPDQLPLAALARAEHTAEHRHAVAVTRVATDAADAGRIVDLLEDPPTGVYRLKGVIPVRTGRGARRRVVNLVGRMIHVSSAPPDRRGAVDGLVAIGLGLDEDAVGRRLEHALRPADGTPDPAGVARLERRRRLSR